MTGAKAENGNEAKGGTKIKICGLTRPEDVEAVNRFLPDYVGFVFAKSRRQVAPAQAAELSRRLDPGICPVGVFVDAEEDFICSLAEARTIRAVQLHGSETPEQVCHLKGRLTAWPGGGIPYIPVIKAVRMEPGHSLGQWQESEADYLLLDAGAGGTGKAFDHSLIGTAGTITKPWFLAGGMTPENCVAAITRFHPYGIDASSGVETDGLKDARKIEEMIRSVRDE